jgi:hypothetical protein
MTNPHSCVYLLYEENWAVYKIGFTTQPLRRRLDQLNNKYHARFRCLGTIYTDRPQELERALHVLLGIDRVTDRREWFYLTPEQVGAWYELENVCYHNSQMGWAARDQDKDRSYREGYDAGVSAGYDQALANEETELTYWREYEERKAVNE